MKPRVLTAIITVVAAAVIVAVATVLDAAKTGVHGWLHAQLVHPLLWLVDVGALGIITAGQFWCATLAHMERGRADQLQQLDSLLVHSQELDHVNAELDQKNQEYGTQIADLSAAVASLREAGETRLQQLSEQALGVLQERVLDNLRQMEAVNLALQYHRAEIKLLRQEMDEVRTGMAALGAPVALPRLSSFPQPSVAGSVSDAARAIPAPTPEAASAEIPPSAERFVAVPESVGAPVGDTWLVSVGHAPVVSDAGGAAHRAPELDAPFDATDAVIGPSASGSREPVSEPAKTPAGLDLDALLAELAATASATLVARRAANAVSADPRGGGEPGAPVPYTAGARVGTPSDLATPDEPQASEAPPPPTASTESVPEPEPNAADVPAETEAAASRGRRLPIAAFMLKR